MRGPQKELKISLDVSQCSLCENFSPTKESFHNAVLLLLEVNWELWFPLLELPSRATDSQPS